MSQTVVGIDLGSYSIKIAQLERSFRDFELVRFAEQVISQGTRLSREEASIAALRLLLERMDIPLDNVAVSFPAHHLSFRVLDLPFTSAKKIEQTLEFELESYVPVPVEDLLIDFHILSIGESSSKVLAAYLPRARLVKYLDLFQSVGIDPRLIGVDAIDLSHMSQVAMVPAEGYYAFLDIGHEKTNITIMEGNQLRYVRSVTVGGVHFTRAIQKAFNLSFEKADGLKMERGKVAAVGEEPDQISRLLKKVADELVVFIRQTLMGLRQLYGDVSVAGLYVCGGGSRLPGLSDFLSSQLKVNVSPIDCLDFIQHRLEQPEEVRDLLPTALSQTIKVIYSNKAIKINFRRGEFAYQRDIKALGTEIKQAAAWLVVVILLGMGNYLFSYTTYQARLNDINDSLFKTMSKEFPDIKNQAKGGIKKATQTIAARMSEIQSQLDSLNPGHRLGALDYLLEISTKIPAKQDVTLDIDDFTFNGDNIRLEGRTQSFEAVDKIKNAVMASPHFKNVNAQNVVKGIRDEIKFSLSLDVVKDEVHAGEPAPEPASVVKPDRSHDKGGT